MASPKGFIRFCALAMSIILTVAQQNTFAGNNKDVQDDAQVWNITKTSGMRFFNPDDVLTGTVRFDELPEVSTLNRNQKGDIGFQLGKLADFLKYNGIPLGLGVNSNRDSFFDLYAPYVDVLLDEPAAEFGTTRASEVGKMHFLTHDSLHLYAGSPGLKKSDLKNREETKKRLTKDLMRLEALGSVWTAMNHVRWYWEWRETQNMTEEQKLQFQKYNKGLSSLGEFNHQDMMDILDAYMSGRLTDMTKLYLKNIDFDTYIQAKDAGVPMLFPDFKEKLGASGERLVVKYGLPILMPLFHMYDKKFGYVNLIKYAAMQADFYMSDWYVEWTDEFRVGQDLETLENNIQRKMDDFRSQKFFSDVPQVHKGVFDVMYMRNAVAQFGRKLIELEYFENQRIQQGRPQLNEQDWKNLKRLRAAALDLNNKALHLRAENRELNLSELELYKAASLEMFSRAEQTLPVDRILPLKDRLGHGDYSNFWRDSFSVIMPRPDGLTKFLSARGLWKSALKQRQERKKMEAKGKTYNEVDLEKVPVVVGDLEQQLAARYNDNRRGAEVQPEKFSENDYLNKLFNYNKAVQAQIRLVFIPQLQEFSQLSQSEHSQIAQDAEDFGRIFDSRIREFAADYKTIFIDYEKNPAAMERLVNTESDLKWAVDRTLNSMADVLDLLEEGKTLKNIQKKLAVMTEAKGQLESHQSVTRGIRDILRNIMPFKKGTVATVCSMITNLCIKREKLNDYFNHTPVQALTGNDKRVEVTFKDEKGNVAEAFELPKNAIVIMALNHDHGLMDLTSMKDVAHALNADTVSVLTNKDVWPIYNMIENKDETVIFKQETGLKQRIANLIEKEQGRFVFSIYPEGDLPYFGANFPVATHFGAFSVARSTAIAQRGKRPVYLIKAMSNFQEATNSQGKTPFKIEVLKPELVPDQEVKGRDSWIEEKRSEFEKESLDHRGTEMIDLIQRGKTANSRVRSVAPVAEYKPAGQFMAEFMKMNPGKKQVSCNKVYSH